MLLESRCCWRAGAAREQALLVQVHAPTFMYSRYRPGRTSLNLPSTACLSTSMITCANVPTWQAVAAGPPPGCVPVRARLRNVAACAPAAAGSTHLGPKDPAALPQDAAAGHPRAAAVHVLDDHEHQDRHQVHALNDVLQQRCRPRRRTKLLPAIGAARTSAYSSRMPRAPHHAHQPPNPRHIPALEDLGERGAARACELQQHASLEGTCPCSCPPTHAPPP